MLAIRFVFCTLSRRPSPVPKTRPVSDQEPPGDIDAHARMQLDDDPGLRLQDNVIGEPLRGAGSRYLMHMKRRS